MIQLEGNAQYTAELWNNTTIGKILSLGIKHNIIKKNVLEKWKHYRD